MIKIVRRVGAIHPGQMMEQNIRGLPAGEIKQPGSPIRHKRQMIILEKADETE